MSALAPTLLPPQKKAVTDPRPTTREGQPDGGEHNASAHRQPNPLHNFPLLRIRDPRRVEPIGELIGGPSGVMPDQGCSEVFRNPCALTLRDEPLTSAVENGPVQLWMSLPEFCIPLHHPVDTEVGEQPASRFFPASMKSLDQL